MIYSELYNYKEFTVPTTVDRHIFTTKFSIFRCTKGNCMLIYKDQQLPFQNKQHLFVFSNEQLTFCKSSKECHMEQFEFSFELLDEITPYIDHIVLVNLSNSTPQYYDKATFTLLNSFLNELILLQQHPLTHYGKTIVQNILSSYMHTLGGLIMTIRQQQDELITQFESNIVQRFFSIIRQYHYTERTAAFYAKELNISERHLYHVIKRALNITPKESIDNEVVSAIKKMLITTNLTIEQISDKLNFPSQSNLRQYFFRLTGMAPSSFRAERNSTNSTPHPNNKNTL